MAIDTKNLVDAYLGWLRDNATERDLDGGWKEITFPYLDRHNDFLRIFARLDRDGLLLTDDGKTIQDLKHSGCDLKAKTKRRGAAEKILRGMGLEPALLDDGKISTTAVNGDLPWKIHGLLMSMLAIDGLANSSSPNVATLFKEEVHDWLGDIGATIKQAVYTGKSGAQHEFDFMVPGKGGHPDQIIQAISAPDRVHIQSFTYEVIDIREVEGQDKLAFYALFNDDAFPGRKQWLTLDSYGIHPLKWSNRSTIATRLAG